MSPRLLLVGETAADLTAAAQDRFPDDRRHNGLAVDAQFHLAADVFSVISANSFCDARESLYSTIGSRVR